MRNPNRRFRFEKKQNKLDKTNLEFPPFCLCLNSSLQSVQCPLTTTKIHGWPQTSFNICSSVSLSHSSSPSSRPVPATLSSAATPFGSDPSSPSSPALRKRLPITSDFSNPPAPLPRTPSPISLAFSSLISCYRLLHRSGSRVDPIRVRVSPRWSERAIGSESRSWGRAGYIYIF